MPRCAVFIAFGFVLTLGTQAAADPVFENRAPALGISHQYNGGWEHFVGGGIASFDCNGDLFPELYVAGGTSAAVLLVNTTPTRAGEVSFTPKTPQALALTGVIGAYPLDIDSDGFLDLFILRVGENHLLKGGLDCTFTADFNLGLDGGDHWTTAFSAMWERENHLPTLAIGNYVDRNDPDGPFQACDTSFLMRPRAGAYQPFALAPGYCPLSMLFSDWGRAGRQDLRISNDRHYYVRGGAEQLWAMQTEPRLYGPDDGWNEISIWGMGIASRDITGDGLPEIFLSSMGDQKLQKLVTPVKGPVFGDATYEQGTTAHRPYIGGDGRPSTGWQVEFGDVNNDGFDDVFIAKGNVEQMPDAAMDDPNNLLMQRPDGSFIEAGDLAGIATMARSRGAALLDMNLDGRLDLAVVNRRAPLEIYQNMTPDTANWMLLDVMQDGTNRRAVGGWIELADGNRTWHREITVGGGHASGKAALTHFGVGAAKDLQVRIIWPDGTASDWLGIEPNRIIRLERHENMLRLREL